MSDGTIYEGNFHFGTKTGVGNLKTKLFEFEGHFQYDFFDGYGIWKDLLTGIIEEGHWTSNLKNGIFKITENNIDTYWLFENNEKRSKSTKKKFDAQNIKIQ